MLTGNSLCWWTAPNCKGFQKLVIKPIADSANHTYNINAGGAGCWPKGLTVSDCDSALAPAYDYAGCVLPRYPKGSIVAPMLHAA